MSHCLLVVLPAFALAHGHRDLRRRLAEVEGKEVTVEILPEPTDEEFRQIVKDKEGQKKVNTEKIKQFDPLDVPFPSPNAGFKKMDCSKVEVSDEDWPAGRATNHVDKDIIKLDDKSYWDGSFVNKGEKRYWITNGNNPRWAWNSKEKLDEQKKMAKDRGFDLKVGVELMKMWVYEVTIDYKFDTPEEKRFEQKITKEILFDPEQFDGKRDHDLLRSLAKPHANALGQMPLGLVNGLNQIILWNSGNYYARAYANRQDGHIFFFINKEQRESEYLRQQLPEVYMHELAHASFDPFLVDRQFNEFKDGWAQAVKADCEQRVSWYAETNRHEDIAETFLAWYALRFRLDRITEKLADKIEEAIPNRLALLDSVTTFAKYGKLADGQICWKGTSCKKCINPATWWAQRGFTACGTESDIPDGVLCGIGTTCKRCKNKYSYWTRKAFTACGPEPQDWKNGRICGVGTTCNNCENHYSYWSIKGFTACGTEPKDWNNGQICAIGTTCNRCKSPQTYWYSKAATACGKEPRWKNGNRCALGTTCNACENKATHWWSLGMTACGEETKMRDGYRCALGTSCKACQNEATYWYSKAITACGQEPKWKDGSRCAEGSTCKACKNRSTYWYSKAITACGREPRWSNGSRCAKGTTCNACQNKATYWYSKAITACGTEPRLKNGERCAMGTSCNRCQNKATWWWSKFGDHCGPEPCWSRGKSCAKGTSCNSCCRGDEWSWSKFAFVCK